MTSEALLHQTERSRIYSIDLLRGLVMIIMALDHTRDFFHAEAFTRDPLDPATTTGWLFFTRFITHYCAPVFILLAGTSIWLQGQRKSKSELAAFLFKRGLWLVFIEVVIITFAWTFDFSYSVFILQVIWAIGVCMILMGLVIYLPYALILLLGLLIVAGHNVFDFVEQTHQGLAWDLIRNGDFAFHEIIPGRTIGIIYPFLPWLGLMMLGYCLGKIYDAGYSTERRRRFLINTGIGLILLFVVLRFINLYGDPHPWTSQTNDFRTFLSFINVHKYPPSLLFICITIGPSLILLTLFEKTHTTLSKAISVFGRVPFFYYILHFYILHTLCMILFLLRGHTLAEGTNAIYNIPFHFLIPGEGYTLSIVYLIWILMVFGLYPLCKWFSERKAKSKHWMMSYL